MLLGPTKNHVVLRHGHMACGIGAGAKGFNLASPRVGNLVAKFECAGGIDVDPGAIRNFERMTGVPGTVMDLFDREQYRAFHGKEPPADWIERCPADIRGVFGKIDILFSSYPCKGFSGLLSNAQSLTDKYQALNALTLRGMWLSLEAYKDDPVPIILFENVPRIATRGRWLLDQIVALLHGYGYHVAESTHDCGEIGGLAQSRKRFLLVARHPDKVPDFMYEPVKHPLRGVGEVLTDLPLPGDPAGGPLHRVPSLQWRTWVRLAFVKAGKDWRSLNDLAVEDGMLRDYGIVPDGLRDNAYGVCRWTDPGPLVTSARAPGQGRFSVADPRHGDAAWHNTSFGVRLWSDISGTVAGGNRPANGAYSVADPRPTQGNQTFAQYGVLTWTDKSCAVTAQSKPGGGAYSIADPRVDGHPASVQLGVKAWADTAGCVTANMWVGSGPNAVADPRLSGKPRFNSTYRIVRFADSAPAVAGPGGPGDGLAVSDPRPPERSYVQRKYKVTPFDHSARTVIGASTTGDGAFAVADPRCTWGPDSHRNKLKVIAMESRAPTVTGSDRVGSGACSVADPRPACLTRPDRMSYLTQGHYGVLDWRDTSGAVPAFAKNNNGNWSIADPRLISRPSIEAEKIKLPEPAERLVARIVAEDGTWHRPFTTLELGALQSLFDPRETFMLDSKSDAECREWIGNAVPSVAAKGMANEVGAALLRARLGITFSLSAQSIWVSPLDFALAVRTNQPAWQMDAGLI